MTYATAISELFALGHELATPAGMAPRKFDLEHMRTMVAALGHPERRFPSVLVAGTNGKGSTSATLASILVNAGYRTGLYTSPHLVHVTERICVDGEAISEPEFTEIYQRLNEVTGRLVANGSLPHLPSFFEVLTTMAFEYFASMSVDIAVLEVGMGGRLDATNIVEPCLSVITDIALDHQEFLGNTISEIAREKAGIIRRNGVLVTLPQHPEANDVIGAVAMERGARAVSAADFVPNVSPGAEKPLPSFDLLRPSAGQMPDFLRTRYFVKFMGEEALIESPLLGRHQLRNVALALAAAEQLNQCGFKITAQNVAAGVRNTHWPGRFQLIPGDGTNAPDFILDVAHNAAGAWALRSALSECFENRPITIVFGAMRDKAISEMAEILFPTAETVIVTQANTPRAASVEQLQVAAAHATDHILTEPTVAHAMERARAVTPKNGLVVITGSIYIVGEAVAELQKQSISGSVREQ